MFKSAVLKLTAFYFALILFVCIVFSIQAYVLASVRISRGAENQEQIFRNYGSFPPPPTLGDDSEEEDEFDPRGEIQERIDNQVARDRRKLLNAILLTDLIILASGTVLCFFVARKTLKPIELLHMAQSRFTADASHELRTPLAVMKTEIEVALLQKLSTTELTQVLKSNLEEVERLTELSDQLLALTKSQSTEEFETLDLSELLVNEIAQSEAKYSVEIQSQLEKGILIAGSQTLLNDMVTILISNAVQYAGDKTPSISVTLKKKGDVAEITIKDSGMGISKNDLPHIFERFYRGSGASKQRSNGHGLGLSLAEEIVKRHGGTISVKSEFNKFTEFKIILQVVKEN